MKIHGTYPFDSDHWKTVRKLTPREAAELVGINEPEQYPDKIEEDVFNRNLYLWLNKGFIVIGDNTPVSIEPDIGLHFRELLEDSPESKGIQSGSKAVYLHDGSYSLIERV